MPSHAFLKGIKVVDLTRALAGPFCSMMLADMGADVIKVESPDGGDESRSWGPPFLSGESAYFLSINRNKKSIALDLKRDEGREILLRLLKAADVFIENFRPGTTARLGIDYESLKKIKPELVYCSISGFGQTGPDSGKPGYDIIALASSGMMSITGEPDRPPVKMGAPLSDIGAGMYSAYAIVCALFRKKATGLGERIDTSLQDGMVSWLTHQAGSFFATGENPPRLGSAHSSVAPYQAFKGKDGSYFVVGVGNDKMWREFCLAIDADGLQGDARFLTNSERVKHRAELEAELVQIFSKDTSANWVLKISQTGIPCSEIRSLSEVFSDPHVVSREMVRETHHPKAGLVKQVGLPYHFANFDFDIRSPPPMLGEHTREILSSLGCSSLEIEKLKSSGIIK
ncbi:MAG: CaiB/BaiF CoA transferase family protein [Nitrososphaerales archaeon]